VIRQHRNQLALVEPEKRLRVVLRGFAGVALDRFRSTARVHFAQPLVVAAARHRDQLRIGLCHGRSVAEEQENRS
jgi:hypothetical protein